MIAPAAMKFNTDSYILGGSYHCTVFIELSAKDADGLRSLRDDVLESGKSAICLDPEHELIDLCANLGGCFADLMSGQYLINPLEPKPWDIGDPIEAQRSGFDWERRNSEMSEFSPSGGNERYGVCDDEGDDPDAP